MQLILFNYFKVAFFGFFVFLLAVFLFLLSLLFSVQKGELEKLSPYECGFNPFEDTRSTFNIDFYIVGLLFLIFDIETIFLLPWVVSLGSLNYEAFWCIIDFFLELAVGFYYVWRMGALEWLLSVS